MCTESIGTNGGVTATILRGYHVLKGGRGLAGCFDTCWLSLFQIRGVGVTYTHRVNQQPSGYQNVSGLSQLVLRSGPVHDRVTEGSHFLVRGRGYQSSEANCLKAMMFMAKPRHIFALG